MPQSSSVKILLVSVLLLAPLWGQASGSSDWSPQRAAAYLDGRLDWWMGWPKAARDHETFCISCHTAVPYALARGVLRTATHEAAPSPQEDRLFENVRRRVRIWDAAEPFYQDASSGAGKSRESRGTESVLNALVLVFPSSSQKKLSPDAELALKNMWGMQETEGAREGAFPWLEFHNRPWEGDSIYYGASLAAIAVGSAPEEYRSRPAVTKQIDLLRDYLRREYANASPVNRVVALWASATLTGILDSGQKKTLIAEIGSIQQPDGGWNIASITGPWSRRDGTPLDTRSDGYATGLVAFALLQNHVSGHEEHLRRGLDWLARNQNAPEGLWPATSLNKERDPVSDAGRFMSDAATAYAVLALTSGN
jgi:squalene-hopene/tetraprenyl-beta-curcumene cyclase